MERRYWVAVVKAEVTLGPLGQAPNTIALLGRVDDLDALERLSEELLGATSWEQLLGTRLR